MDFKERLVELLSDVGLCHYETIAEHLILNNTKVVVPCSKCVHLRKGRVVFSCRHPEGLKHPNPMQNTFCPFGEEIANAKETN